MRHFLYSFDLKEKSFLPTLIKIILNGVSNNFLLIIQNSFLLTFDTKDLIRKT